MRCSNVGCAPGSGPKVDLKYEFRAGIRSWGFSVAKIFLWNLDMRRLLAFASIAIISEAIAGCAKYELPEKYLYQVPAAGTPLASIRGSTMRDGTLCCEISTYVYSVNGKVVKDGASNALSPLALETGAKTLMLRADRRSKHSMVSVDVSMTAGQRLLAKSQWIEATGDVGAHCEFSIIDEDANREIATIKDGYVEGTGGAPVLIVPIVLPHK